MKKQPQPSPDIEPRARFSDIAVWCRYDKELDIAELVENPRNPNTHPDAQVALLAKIIRAQGCRNPVVVSNRSGFIVKGHGRLQAARVLDVATVPVEFQDYENEAQEYADLVADNRIAELAEPDLGMLGDLIGDEDLFADFDLDPKYVDVAIKRWEDFTGKKAEVIQDGTAS